MSENFTCGFIGLGLIGGSIARAIRLKYPRSVLIGYDPETESLEMARRDKILDIAAGKIDSVFSQCSVIFLCAPVSSNDDNLLLLKKFLSPDTLLTDVGSVKTDIHSHIRELGLEKQFIGGHPMAGSERTGYQNSKAKLLENAYYIMTPAESVPESKISFFRDFIVNIGAIPLVLSCQEHDYVTAGVSHLPHVISASLVNLVRESDNPEGIMKMIAAGGFKDITRISSSSPIMWEHICLSNTENITLLLDRYIQDLQNIRETIAQKDSQAIYSFFEAARSYRESFIESSSGPIKKTFVIYVEIPDEPGALATIVSLLAFQRINIKNIGITHNREVEEGSLRVELHEEKDIKKAQQILEDKNYLVRIPV